MTENHRNVNNTRLWLAAILLAVVWFANLEYRVLIHPDEGRYAEIPREMVVKGDWITPRLNDLKYFEKPPLQYWATTLAYEAFGEHNWTARFYPALTGFVGVLLIFFAGRRLFGITVAMASAFILASSFLYLLGAQALTLDMGLTFFLNLALISFLLAQQAETTTRGRRGWMWLAWSAIALAVLSKGVIGIVLPGLALLGYTVWHRDWGLWRRLHLASGLVLFLLIAAPWFIAVSLREPTFPDFFFVREHFQRFAQAGHNRTGAWWYFLPILALGMLPWLGLLITALRPGARPRGKTGIDSRRFLLVWCFSIFLFFSLSQSKLPFYILPILPPLALLMALELVTFPSRRLAGRFAPIALLAMVMLSLLPAVGRFAAGKVPPELLIAYQPWLTVAVLWLLLFSLAATLLAWRNRPQAAVLLMAIAGLGFAEIALTESNELAPGMSSYVIVDNLRSEVDAFDPRVPFFSIEQYDQTLPFYLKRPVTLVNHADELAMGIDLEPEKAIADERAFSARWRTLDQAYAILPIRELPEFNREGLPYRDVARDWRRVVIARH